MLIKLRGDYRINTLKICRVQCEYLYSQSCKLKQDISSGLQSLIPVLFLSRGLLLDPVFALPPCVNSWPLNMTAGLSLTPRYLLENRLIPNTLLPWAAGSGNAYTPRKLFLLLTKKGSRLWVKLGGGVKPLMCVLLYLTRILYVSATVH